METKLEKTIRVTLAFLAMAFVLWNFLDDEPKKRDKSKFVYSCVAAYAFMEARRWKKKADFLEIKGTIKS